jgi:hypothetical protein
MNSVIGIGLQVRNGSYELLRALKTCLRAVGSACLFFNMVDLVFGTRCVQMLGNQILYCGIKYTLHTTSEHGVSSITTADAHTSAASSRLNLTPPAD